MNFKKPIASFDIESTGTDVVKDKICELSVCIIQPNGEYKQQTFRFNPQKPSHPEALKVHKITEEELEYEPLFKDVAHELFDTCFKGNDLHGYNIKRFDICILQEEFARCGISFPEEGTLIFDSFTIFSKQYPRDLSSAYKHYTTKTLENAHSAEYDVAATVAIFDKQVAMHFENTTPEELAAYCKDPGMVDFNGKLTRNEHGELCFAFGKSKDVPVKKDTGYARWMLNMDFFTQDTKNHIKRELGILPDPLAAKKPEEKLPASSADEEFPF